MRVIAALGDQPVLPRGRFCCGLTWYSTGQLGVAKRVLASSVTRIASQLSDGAALVVLEPSCASMLREEAEELLPGDPTAQAVARSVVSLGEYLTQRFAEGVPSPFGAFDGEVLAQVHCHQRSTKGYGAEASVLGGVGATVVGLEQGCCGLAGNFGFEAGHFEISKTIGDRGILGAIAQSGDATVVLADGFSCRTQIDELATKQGRHLAEILADLI
jgi:Fe-S oxidoreductase